MPSDLTWFEKLKGKRYGNIELPSEGTEDPKLKGTSTRERLAMVRPSMEALKKRFKDENKKAYGDN